MKKAILIIVGIATGLLLCAIIGVVLILPYFVSRVANSIKDADTSSPTPEVSTVAGGPNTFTPIQLDICSLFTEAEATSLLKTSVTQNSSGAESNACSYSAKDMQKFGLIAFTVSRSTDTTAKIAFESVLGSDTYKDKLVEVSGLNADKVYASKDYSIIIALKGLSFVTITGSSTAYPNNNKDLLIPVATKVLSRL